MSLTITPAFDAKRLCMSGASLLALSILVAASAPAVASAQTAAGAPAPEETEVGEVQVTGSRIVRDGYQAPTPTTVLGVEEIQKSAPVNIANYVNELPQLSATTTPRTGNAGTSNGANGINSLNLRGLGVNRTLVLLDGQRVAPASTNGAVDINNLPTALVQRVEVVTGGASAAYGSDAVAGVVNFILDKKYEGLKGSVSGGISDRSDGRSWNAELAGGMAFAGGRGHILASAEAAWTQGVDQLDPDKRKWWQACNMLSFAATVRPQRIVTCGVNTRFQTYGGVITSTALNLTTFGQGGAVGTMVVGTPVDSLFMVGGSPTYSEGTTVALEAAQRRRSLWSRVSYDLTDTITASLEASYGFSHSQGGAAFQRYASNTALTIRSDNAFLPASVVTRAQAANVTSFAYGYSTYDLGRPRNWADRESYRTVASLDGKFNDKWTWNAYYQYGQTKTDVELQNTTITSRIMLAIDAVRNPAGQIVCRSTLTNPTNGCVPLNVFGVGVASPEAIAYVKGVATQDLTMKQQVAAASVSGEVYDLPAGPVSVATGFEWRKESISGTADATSLVNGYFTGNFKPTFGEFNVKEVFGETIIPIVRDLPFAQSVEFNGAVRYTDYSLSGTVTTWKAGLSWTPMDSIRVRGVLSRDIRAPNTGELFQAGATARQDVTDTTDPRRPLYSATRVTSGNVDLKPEVADTTSFGVVLRPSFLPEVSASIDYYDISIHGAVATVNSQQTVDRCALGEQELCALIIRNSAGAITQINGFPVNVAKQKTRGVDFEVTWRHDLGDLGDLTVRGLASHVWDFYTVNGAVVTNPLGENTGSVPKWRYIVSATWDWEKVSATLQARGFSDGVYDRTWHDGIEIDDNDIPGATYWQFSANYRLMGEKTGRRVVLFGTIENLFDKDPPIVAGNSFSATQTNPTLYDQIGRNYRVGVRFQY